MESVGHFVREFQVFAKPVGPACNLNCAYCYYQDTLETYPGKDFFLMTDDILEAYIKQHIEASTEDIVFFSWHGGEPLLAGPGFYRKVLKYQKKYSEGSVIVNGIQTNGTLLDHSWCAFLSGEGFKIGISIDGPGFLHNIYRRTIENNNTFLNVIRGYELMQMHGVTPEILCVVNSNNVEHPTEVYQFLKTLGVKYITFLPLVERQALMPGGVSRRSVPADKFGNFLVRIFEEWLEHDIGNIKIQIIEEALRTAFNQEHTLCVFKRNCGGVPVVEHNGDFYSCDHFVNADHMLGNILDRPLSYFLDCDRQKTFGLQKSVTLPEYCKSCEVLSMCNGECPKNRFLKSPDGEAGLNYLCKGYKNFFNHCKPFAEAIAEAYKGVSLEDNPPTPHLGC